MEIFFCTLSEFSVTTTSGNLLLTLEVNKIKLLPLKLNFKK